MTDAMHREPSELPHLMVEAEGHPAREIPLLDGLTIGRADDNGLKLLDPKVSRHHASISREGTRFVLTDLGSANGTFVDGIRLTCPHYLRHGEQIVIGDARLAYHEMAAATATTLVTAVPAAVAQAAQAARGETPKAAPSRHESGSPIGSLILIAAVLLIALAVVGIYFLAPSLFGRDKETAVPTAIVVASPTAAAATALPATETPAATPLPTAVANPIDAQELADRLAEAHKLALRSKTEQAVAIYEELAGRAPTDAGPEIGWAWALILDNEPGQALPHAQQAVTLAPDSVEAAVVLARAHADLGNKTEALAQAQLAVKLGTNVAAAHAVLAEALQINQLYAEAADQADLALVQDINNADAHRARGWLYYLTDQDVGRAMSELHIAAGLQTELWLRRHELGELLLEGQNYTTAIIAFQDALNLRPKAVTYAAIGDAYYQLGQFDPARVSLMQAISAGADDARTYGLLAITYTRLGRCDDARSYVDDALALDATDNLALEAQSACQVGAPPPTAMPTATELAAGQTPEATPKPTRSAVATTISGRIAFPVWNTKTSTYDVYIANTDGTGRRRVVEGFDQPALSADGKWLAARGRKPDMRNLFVLRLSDGSIKKITENVEDNLPSWSPEGGRLVFASTKDQPGHPKAIYVIDPVPLEGRQMVDGRRVQSGPGPVQAEYPTWMPDGRLVYKGCDYTVEPMSCGIFIINSDGGPFVQLTRKEQDAAPSGHTGRITFMSNRDGNWEIYHIRDDASHLRRLTNNASDDGLPVWSPDGKAIAFVSNQGGPWAVWVMNPDGSGRRKLFDIGGGGLDANWVNQRISWVP